MSVFTVGCGVCKGKPMERLEERDNAGCWHHNRGLPPELADAWIEADSSAPLRWAVMPCPRCAGVGEYDVESTPCKVF